MPLINTRGAASIKGFGFAGFSPTVPGMPTSVSASATSCSAISVSFTAPTCNGGLSIDYYQAVCTSSGTHSATGSSSPISITGLSASTSYTFHVRAHNSKGYGCYSSNASASTTAPPRNSQSYTSAGSYSWVAPSGVTKVSTVAVGGGSGGCSNHGGGGGGLGYKNNVSVSPGSSYTVNVGAGSSGVKYLGCNSSGGNSSALCAIGYGSTTNHSCPPSGHPFLGGSYSGCGGGSGGNGGCYGGGGGAGGYSGSGGRGAYYTGGQFRACAGCGGGGGGGAARQGGGGVGIYGQGSNGSAGGVLPGSGIGAAAAAGGGSGGSNGGTTPYSSIYCNCCGYYYCRQSGQSGSGGGYGGGGGSTSYCVYSGGNGGVGAVRIVYPGNTRTFPSTCVGSP